MRTREEIEDRLYSIRYKIYCNSTSCSELNHLNEMADLLKSVLSEIDMLEIEGKSWANEAMHSREVLIKIKELCDSVLIDTVKESEENNDTKLDGFND